MNVAQGDIPVASLRNTSSRQVEECNVGDDLTAHLNSLITVLPEDATDKRFTWSVAVGNAVQAVEIDANGRVKAIAPDTVTLVATSTDNANATVSVTVRVHNPAKVIQFAAQSLSMEYHGSPVDISKEIAGNISFGPAGFETLGGLTITSDHANVVSINNVAYTTNNGLSLTSTILGVGTATITVGLTYRDYLASYGDSTSAQTVSVTEQFTVNVVQGIPNVVSLRLPGNLTLSRYHDTVLTLMASPDGGLLNQDDIDIRISASPNIGWGAGATVTPLGNDGLRWNLRGRFTGDYDCQVYYKGELQRTIDNGDRIKLHIPAEYSLEEGWDWISIYASNVSSRSLPLKANANWMGAMQLDENNYVIEIRSQRELLYNDPVLGPFGDIEQLTSEDGMYKVHTIYNSSKTSEMMFATTEPLLQYASSQSMPQVRSSYTWITYPHELNHRLDVLAPYLSMTAEEGDMIIGRDGFALYDGTEWTATDDFQFYAGKGYIYYTGNTEPRSINWGPSILPPDEASAPTPAARRAVRVTDGWTTRPYDYPDCMAVIAQLAGEDAADYVVGAFVDDECRGLGSVNADGRVYLAVTGQPGEHVSFRLWHRPTSKTFAVDGSSLNFTTRAGTAAHPVPLMSHLTGIADATVGELTLFTADGCVMVSGARRVPHITVTDLQGHCVATIEGTVLSLAPLPVGVYVVQATDGYSQVTKKIKK